MRNFLMSCAAALAIMPMSVMADGIEVNVTYLRQQVQPPPVLSNLDSIPETLGIDGAQVGLADNATTGQFMGHSYALNVVDVEIGGDAIAAATAALADSQLLILDAPADVQTAIADLAGAQGALLFNASAPDARLRGTDCRANLLHTLPSDAMRADALMQVLQRKRFDKLAMVYGAHPGDHAWADALRGSAQKFGLRIVGEKEWVFDADMRRNAPQEVPLFTQEFRDHDLLLVADELGDFGRYIAYNTWLPRPVAGSEGLSPVTWSRVVEQWGAAQLQSRFTDHSHRDMRPRDYAAWAAMRTIGEAVTRTNSADPARLRDFILSEKFELAGFKGRPLSFRTWNGQLRQPIPVVTTRAVVMMAPVEGFLHPNSELDTLGSDRPETTCTAFTE